MTLSESEEQYLIDRLNRIEQRQLDAILLSEEAFLAWLEIAARWIFEKVLGAIGTVIQWLRSVFFH